jgi:hypothetical protein
MDAVSSSDYIVSNDMIINEQWVGADVEVSGCSLSYGTIPEFAWRDWVKPREPYVRISGLLAEI